AAPRCRAGSTRPLRPGAGQRAPAGSKGPPRWHTARPGRRRTHRATPTAAANAPRGRRPPCARVLPDGGVIRAGVHSSLAEFDLASRLDGLNPMTGVDAVLRTQPIQGAAPLELEAGRIARSLERVVAPAGSVGVIDIPRMPRD